jgi:L-alanine-DL-glutamate epimerase-like enolase superfamily enzyme
MKRRNFINSVALTGASSLILPGSVLDETGDNKSIETENGTSGLQQESAKSMKIKEVKLYILEDPKRKANTYKLVQVPGLLRTQYTHKSQPTDQPVRQNFIEVITDSGIVGRCTTAMLPGQIEILRNQVIGEDPLQRERLYQKLYKGTRWVYQTPGWFGDFDNCLWDITGKVAGLPVYALAGKVRDRFPAYMTGGDATVSEYLRAIELGKAMGIQAYKFHSYKGGKADMPIFREVRKEVGPDYALIDDPVCSYTLREAIEVGHLMEELNFVWLEEPMHEQKMNLYQELCKELTIPVMATEMLMNDIGLSSQWLIQGATDRLRANARNGTTQVFKLAHLAELHGTNVELNGQGGLFGLLHAHLGCCIDNADYYEYMSTSPDANRSQGEQWGLLNAPLIEDGHLMPPDGPGWGALWDEKKFKSLITATY